MISSMIKFDFLQFMMTHFHYQNLLSPNQQKNEKITTPVFQTQAVENKDINTGKPVANGNFGLFLLFLSPDDLSDRLAHKHPL